MSDGKRTYQAIVWSHGANTPGERLTLQAENLEDAERQLKDKYGENVVFTLYSEEDAGRPR
jgi:hypothetical protein